jgi:hypothetical protein
MFKLAGACLPSGSKARKQGNEDCCIDGEEVDGRSLLTATNYGCQLRAGQIRQVWIGGGVDTALTPPKAQYGAPHRRP